MVDLNYQRVLLLTLHRLVGFGRDDVRMLMNFDDVIVYILKDWIDVKDFMDKNGIVMVN